MMRIMSIIVFRKELFMVINKHGSFYMRSGWGTKIIDAVSTSPEIFSPSNEQVAVDNIGLGRIMIKALRYWSGAMGLCTEEKGQGGIELVPTKEFDFIKLYDHYFQVNASLLLMHRNLANNLNDATAWYWLFNEWKGESIDKESFVDAFHPFDNNESKILFYLSLQNIASVSKTTENFQRQGMPLSVRRVYEYLKSQVPLVPGDNQQTVLYYSLDKIISNKPQNDNSLLEFSPILRIIESQVLTPDDFHDLHLFSMSLTDLGKKNINLSENYKLFRSISLALHDQELGSTLSSFEPRIIKDIERKYENDEECWDKDFTFEGIVKYKRSNTKKFKIEQPILLLDNNDVEVDKDYYIDFVGSKSASFIIFTKDFINEKKFKISLRFSQKATVVGVPDFVVEQTNSRGNAYRILLDKTDPYYQGKVKFIGGKKVEYTIYVSVLNAPIGLFADSCVGMKEEKEGYVYQLESRDYTVLLGDEGSPITINVEMHGNNAISYPVNTSNQTKIRFNHSDDEAVKDYLLKLDLDDDATQLITKVKFSEEKLQMLETYELFNRCFVGHNVFSVDDEKIYNKNRRSEKYGTNEFDVSGNKYRLNDLLVLESRIISSKILSCKTTGLKNEIVLDLKVPDL